MRAVLNKKSRPRHKNEAQREIETDGITSYDAISDDVMVQHAVVDDVMMQQLMLYTTDIATDLARNA